MSESGSRVVLDAQPVIAFLRGEPAADTVQRVLHTARCSGEPLPLCAVNFCEVVYTMHRAQGPVAAAGVASVIYDLPIRVVPVDSGLALRAAALKAENSLGLGDAFAAALALESRLPLMTGDADFRAVPGLDLAWTGE